MLITLPDGIDSAAGRPVLMLHHNFRGGGGQVFLVNSHSRIWH